MLVHWKCTSYDPRFFVKVSHYNHLSDEMLHSSLFVIPKPMSNTKGQDYLSEVNVLRLKVGFGFTFYLFALRLSVQFSSVSQSCPTLCDPMNHSTPGLPVHHHLLEFTQTHVHRVSDAIQPSHPLSSPSPSAPNPSHHQGLFQ